ncbi:MAG: hypothetical protein KJ077_19935 [Anaerolineae bacterium]|nr:hypothetical protein [Anaerolineae bacterium]
MRRYVLLLRHGEIDRNTNKPDEAQSLMEGGQDIASVAHSFAEHLKVQPGSERISIGKIWYGSYLPVRQTAGVLYDTLKKNGVDIDLDCFECCTAFDPKQFWAAEKTSQRKEIGDDLLDSLKKINTVEGCEKGSKVNAILVIGHAPQLGWIAETILRKPFPLARAELVCLAVSDSWWDWLLWQDRWVMWTISSSDDKAHQELRAKIDSKMKLAGILGGLITGTLGLGLGALLKGGSQSTPDPVLIVSTVLFLIALALYLATVYAYDRLLMPTRFWAEQAAKKERRWLVQRPPSSATWILYQNMMRVWNWMFTPATYAVVAGLLFLAHAVVQFTPIIWGLVLFWVVVFAVYYRRLRPTLGTED